MISVNNKSCFWIDHLIWQFDCDILFAWISCYCDIRCCNLLPALVRNVWMPQSIVISIIISVHFSGILENQTHVRIVLSICVYFVGHTIFVPVINMIWIIILYQCMDHIKRSPAIKYVSMFTYFELFRQNKFTFQITIV